MMSRNIITRFELNNVVLLFKLMVEVVSFPVTRAAIQAYPEKYTHDNDEQYIHCIWTEQCDSLL